MILEKAVGKEKTESENEREVEGKEEIEEDPMEESNRNGEISGR